jgi:hypothetical protein
MDGKLKRNNQALSWFDSIEVSVAAANFSWVI